MEYTLKRSLRARNLRIAVHPDGRIVLTAPARASDRVIERFAKQYEGWVHKALERTKGKKVVTLRRGDIPALKRKALHFAQERCALYAARYSLTYKKITIRAQKSRWGSCSHAGNLSFNYKIAALPPEIAEYIIVHEICHLAELNHSRAFWSLVEKESPEHRRVRKELRTIVFRFD